MNVIICEKCPVLKLKIKVGYNCVICNTKYTSDWHIPIQKSKHPLLWEEGKRKGERICNMCWTSWRNTKPSFNPSILDVATSKVKYNEYIQTSGAFTNERKYLLKMYSKLRQ